MTIEPKDLIFSELEAINAQASVLMKHGICLLASAQPESAAKALAFFDSALKLRVRLPTETVPRFGYALAACWLNRAEALMQLENKHADHTIAALHAYDEAILLLRKLPLYEDAKFRRRLAIAYQNRGLTLQIQNGPESADASVALLDAIAVLDHDQSALIPDRRYLLGTVWLNLANSYTHGSDSGSNALAQDAARRAIAFVADLELSDADAAEVGIKARHVLCQTLAPVLSLTLQGHESLAADLHQATDAADDGLVLAQHWEQKGVARFRNIACDLFRFGAHVYARYQPQFLNEFVLDNLNPDRSSAEYVRSPEMRCAAEHLDLRRCERLWIWPTFPR